jgi:alkylation response protein AidB-like acyl-CoA dehydrogenase
VPASLADAARTLAPALEARVAEMDEAARLPADLAKEMAAAGVMRMLVPARLGGPEAHPVEMIDALGVLAAANPSAGWCAMISSTTSALGGWLPDPDAADVFGDALGVWGGGFAPTGTATTIDGGFWVEGRWAWGSGSQNATWLCGGTIGDDGVFRLCFVPAAEVEIIENWDVVGLRGTGSHDWQVAGAEVPAGRALAVFEAQPVARGKLYHVPLFGLLATGIASVALGIAEAALAELVELAGGKIPLFGGRRLADRSTVQAEVARRAAALHAARAFLRAAATDAYDDATAEHAPSDRRRAELRLAASHATRTAAEVTTALFTLGGGTSVRQDHRLGALLRDAHTATQHAMVASAVDEPCGRVVLGLPLDRPDL